MEKKEKVAKSSKEEKAKVKKVKEPKGAANAAPKVVKPKKKFKPLSDLKRSLPYLLLAMPGLITLIVYRLVPLFGLILPFKEYRPVDGFFKSKWVGFENFEFLFGNKDVIVATQNTIFYNFVGIITGIIFGVGIALLLYELSNKFVKIYQTILYLPHFVSFVVVAFMMKGLLDLEYGIFNNVREYFAFEPINWYAEPKYWYWIIPLLSIWKGLGNGALMYYAALIGISPELYESARIDGAGKLQQVWHISIPMIKNVVIVLFILNIGKIMHADLSLYYNVPLNQGVLYEATDVLDTYVLRSLKVLGEVGMSSAAALYQAVVGFILVIISNTVAKKVDPESGMF